VVKDLSPELFLTSADQE